MIQLLPRKLGRFGAPVAAVRPSCLQREQNHVAEILIEDLVGAGCTRIVESGVQRTDPDSASGYRFDGSSSATVGDRRGNLRPICAVEAQASGEAVLGEAPEDLSFTLEDSDRVRNSL